MTENTNINSNAVSVSFNIAKLESGLPVSIKVTPSHANGTELRIGKKFGSMAQSALNAAVDYFHFGCEFGMGCHMEKGLHLNVPKEALSNLPYAEDLGYISKNYAGSLLIPSPKGDWGLINVNMGKFKTTQVAYRNAEKEQAITNKHNFVDMLIDGFTFIIDLGKVNVSWREKAVATLENPNKQAAWAEYQNSKNEASVRSEAYRKGRKIGAVVRDAQKDGAVVTDRQQAIINAVDTIKVTINGETVETPIKNIHAGSYSVVNTRGNQMTSTNVTGSQANRDMLRSWALKGWALVTSR